MSGFGPAFAESFNAGLERKARKREDEFRLMYQDFMEQRKYRDERRRESEKTVRLAKTLTEQAGVDKRAWTVAYEWLTSGADERQVLENLKNGEFSFGQTRQEVTQPVDEEMANVGLAQPQAQPQKTPDRSGIFGKLLGGHKYGKNVSRIAELSGTSPEEVQATLANKDSLDLPQVDRSGIIYRPKQREEEFYSDLGDGLQALADAKAEYEENPTPLNKEKLDFIQRRVDALQMEIEFKEKTKAGAMMGGLPQSFQVKVLTPEGDFRYTSVKQAPDGTVTDLSGQPIEGEVVGNLGEEELKSYMDIMETTGKQANEYRKNLTDFKSIVSDVAQMSRIVDQTNGQVLAQRTAGLSSWLVDLAQDFFVAYDILSAEEIPELNRVFELAETQGISRENLAAVNSLDERIDRIFGEVGTGINNLAVANALFTAKKKILAYKLGILMGQEGRALSEVERGIFEELAGGGTTPEKFRQNITSLIGSQLRTLKEQARNFNEYNNKIIAHEDAFGVPGLFPRVNDPEEELASSEDPYIQEGYNIIRSYGPIFTVDQPASAPIQKPVQPQGSTEILTKVPVNTPEELRNLPDNVKTWIAPDGTEKLNPNYNAQKYERGMR